MAECAQFIGIISVGSPIEYLEAHIMKCAGSAFDQRAHRAESHNFARRVGYAFGQEVVKNSLEMWYLN